MAGETNHVSAMRAKFREQLNRDKMTVMPGGFSPLYARMAEEIGFDLQDMYTGGGSDGNFTAALGVPTLDGLGADGRGAHAHDEQIYFSSLESRTALWIRLFETLE